MISSRGAENLRQAEGDGLSATSKHQTPFFTARNRLSHS